MNTEKLPTGYVKCADHNGVCSNLPIGSRIYYGTGDKYYSKPVDANNTTYKCDHLTFGDPNYGLAKSCYRQPQQPTETLPAQYIKCADHNGTCSNLPIGTRVYYGADGKFYSKPVDANNTTYKCTNLVFGNPNAGATKSCYRQPPPTETKPDDYVYCADEGGKCADLPVGSRIYYGADGKFYSKPVSANALAYDCNDSVFLNPNPNQAKACYKKPTKSDEILDDNERARIKKIERERCNVRFKLTR